MPLREAEDILRGDRLHCRFIALLGVAILLAPSVSAGRVYKIWGAQLNEPGKYEPIDLQ